MTQTALTFLFLFVLVAWISVLAAALYWAILNYLLIVAIGAIALLALVFLLALRDAFRAHAPQERNV